MKTAISDLSGIRHDIKLAEASITVALGCASPGERMMALEEAWRRAPMEKRDAFAAALIGRVAVASR